MRVVFRFQFVCCFDFVWIAWKQRRPAPDVVYHEDFSDMDKLEQIETLEEQIIVLVETYTRNGKLADTKRVAATSKDPKKYIDFQELRNALQGHSDSCGLQKQ